MSKIETRLKSIARDLKMAGTPLAREAAARLEAEVEQGLNSGARWVDVARDKPGPFIVSALVGAAVASLVWLLV